MSIRDEFIGDNSVVLPVTFDYRGGRSNNSKTSVLVTLISAVLVIFVSVGLFARESTELYMKFVYFATLLLGYSLFLRFVVFKEKKFRGAFTEEEGRKDAMTSYWGIYKIDDSYPYTCHYIDSKRGIFVSLLKDVFVGKGSDVVSKHYDAVSDAYNVAHRMKVEMVSVDYMDSVGNDTRINSLYAELSHSSNESLKTYMGYLYRGLLDNVEGEFASYDVYCLTTGNKNVDLRRVLNSVVAEFLNGNYVAYRVLDSTAVKQMCATLTNNPQFSASEACERVLNVTSFRSFKPLCLIQEDGTAVDLKSGDVPATKDSVLGDTDEVLETVEDVEVDSEEEFDIL